jgi:hypothetical protein
MPPGGDETAAPVQEANGMGAARPGVEPSRAGIPAGAPVWSALLAPVNADLHPGTPDGAVVAAVTADSLIVEVGVEQVPAGITHLQHIHGFVDGSSAGCPAPSAADDNGDGIIDLIETRDASGVTMIPLHGDPASLELTGEGYPSADEEGRYVYRGSADLDDLREALASNFGVEDLALGDRVVYVHGVPSDTDLPETVRSLEGVPAHVTLPVACGTLSLED